MHGYDGYEDCGKEGGECDSWQIVERSSNVSGDITLTWACPHGGLRVTVASTG